MKPIWVLGSIGIGVFAAWQSGVLWPHLSWHVDTDARYRRVHIGLTHKGAPADIDFVVRCKDNVTRWRSGGTSVDPSPQKGPVSFVRAIDGGHAVGVELGRPAVGGDPCDTRLPPDWLPFVIWYDRAEDLSFGIGYLTQDAYENPNAQLEFHGATVETSTRDAYEQRLASAPANLLPPWSVNSLNRPPPPLPQDLTPFIDEPWRAWWYDSFAHCSGVIRVPLLPQQQVTVRSWRPEGSARLWRPTAAGHRVEALFDRKSPGHSTPQETARGAWAAVQTYSVHRKVQLTDNISENFDFEHMRPQVFPLKEGEGLHMLRITARLDGGFDRQDIHLGDGLAERGFVYCEHSHITVTKKIAWLEYASMPKRPHKVCLVDGVVFDRPSHDCAPGGLEVLEGNKYVLREFDF